MGSLSSYVSTGNLYTIYALIDPRDETIRYVGITDDVYRRFKEHLAGEDKNPQKDNWIQTLKVEQMMLIMRTLATANDYHQALALEMQWVQKLLAEGCSLFNIAGVTCPAPRERNCSTVYDGRFHLSYSEMNEVLDAYILWGILPQGVSERQRRTYRNHPRLEERRKLLGM